MKRLKPARRYHAPRREQQAQSTRVAIAAAARRLFAAHGYAATTIERVAHEAGVAVQTVYAVYGSKRAILSGLIDAVDADAEIPVHVARIRAAADPRQQLRLAVELTTNVFSRGYDVVDILRGAGTADPDLASAWREGEARRRPGQEALVKHWASTGALRPGVTRREAADVLWAMTGPDVYRLFVVENGWPLPRFRTWLVKTLEALLLDDRRLPARTDSPS